MRNIADKRDRENQNTHEGIMGEVKYSFLTQAVDGIQQHHALAPLPPGKSSVPTEYEPGWSPEPLCSFLGREKSLAPSMVQTPRRLARSVDSVPTTELPQSRPTVHQHYLHVEHSSIPASCHKGTGFLPLPNSPTTLTAFHCFPQSLHANGKIAPYISPQPLRPTYFRRCL